MWVVGINSAGEKYRYIMKNNNPTRLVQIEKEISKEYIKQLNNMCNEFDMKVRFGELTSDEANFQVGHEICKNIVKKFDESVYIRERIVDF